MSVGIHSLCAGLLLGSVRFGPVGFVAPAWLALVLICTPLALWIGRKSLSGLGTSARRVALVIRLLVIVLIAGAMAEPQWRRQSKDVAVTVITDASSSVPPPLQAMVDEYVETAAGDKREEDRLGLVTAAKDAYVQTLPSKLTEEVEKLHIGSPAGTNLAEAVRLAIAVMPQDAANRLVLASDGNETEGSLLEAAAAAKAAGVVIDALPLAYEYEGEVLMDRLVAPATARMGETVNLRAVLTATRATRGRLLVTLNGEALDLDPSGEGVGVEIELEPGTNPPLTIPLTMSSSGPVRFEAVFEPEQGSGDVILENNRQLAVTFVQGEGKILVYRNDPIEAQHIVRALREARIEMDEVTPEQGPQSLTELGAYDAIVMVNMAAYDFSLQRQDELRQYVHDSGGGLVMIGGDRSFGAGGWIGSPLEEALPIRLDPPSKRQMPLGALALVIHSVEIPNGVYLGKQICQKAADALSRMDFIGIVEDNWQGGATWVHPMMPKGDGVVVGRAINNLRFGDMPAFGPSLQLALAGLTGVPAGQKHCIIVSDGDPSPPSRALLQQFRQASITITCVGVSTHGTANISTMKAIAAATGGRYFQVDPGQAGTVIPEIITKEAVTVRRSLIWEGKPFSPQIVPIPSEPMRDISAVPVIDGYVVTADREGLSQVTLRGMEEDPIAAHWQYGLGRAVTFTSDAGAKWAEQWAAWDSFRKFWEQHARWAMRPSGSARMNVVTQTEGDETLVIVEALDEQGERLDFARFQGRVATPDGQGRDLELRGGLGRYEGRFKSDQPGSYLINLRYLVPREGAEPEEGTVQASVTRPFADEYRTLKDNTPLLKQVAEMTGGRVLALAGDPVRARLWDRSGLTMPVATRAMWLGVALAGIGLFLLDVAVRRVRIDIPAMVRAVRRALTKGQEKAGAQMESLRRVRAEARQRMAQAAEDVERAGVQETAKVKFEAPEGAAATSPVDVAAPPRDAPPTEAPEQQKQEEGGISRLMEAKRRARKEMEEQ